jgi:serine/threonine protein kinase
MIFCVISGLKKLHDSNIVHRDLKPSNIFINEDGIYKIGIFLFICNSLYLFVCRRLQHSTTNNSQWNTWNNVLFYFVFHFFIFFLSGYISLEILGEER